MTDEETYTRQLDREQVTQARKKPFPDLAKVRRVRVDEDVERRDAYRSANSRDGTPWVESHEQDLSPNTRPFPHDGQDVVTDSPGVQDLRLAQELARQRT